MLNYVLKVLFRIPNYKGKTRLPCRENYVLYGKELGKDTDRMTKEKEAT